MKKNMIIMVFSLLLIVGLAGAFWGPSIAFAAYRLWDSCPRGIVNCIYPGLCHSYIDTNRDSICDRSQSNPEPSSSSTTSGSGAQTNSTSSLPIPSITPQLSPGSKTSRSSTTTNSSGDTLVAGTSDSIIRNSQEIVADTSTTNETENAITISDNRNYYFIPIFMVIIVLYTITWILSARKVIGNLLHRKIWNMILLISSIGSLLLGLILTLNIDFDTNITLPFNMLFWHVEAGIALGIVALFHIFWHWRYFTKILRMPK